VRLGQRLTLREYQKGLAGNQILVTLSYQCTKDAFRSIPPDRVAEPPPDNNSDSARSIIHPVRQQIEQGRRNPPPMTFDGFNVPARP